MGAEVREQDQGHQWGSDVGAVRWLDVAGKAVICKTLMRCLICQTNGCTATCCITVHARVRLSKESPDLVHKLVEELAGGLVDQRRILCPVQSHCNKARIPDNHHLRHSIDVDADTWRWHIVQG